jgi:hypothetical protein
LLAVMLLLCNATVAALCDPTNTKPVVLAVQFEDTIDKTRDPIVPPTTMQPPPRIVDVVSWITGAPPTLPEMETAALADPDTHDDEAMAERRSDPRLPMTRRMLLVLAVAPPVETMLLSVRNVRGVAEVVESRKTSRPATVIMLLTADIVMDAVDVAPAESTARDASP